MKIFSDDFAQPPSRQGFGVVRRRQRVRRSRRSRGRDAWRAVRSRAWQQRGNGSARAHRNL